MQLLPFKFEHFELFEWRPEEAALYNTDSEFTRAIINAAENGECYTAVHDGRIVWIGGVMKMSKKTGYCFTIFSKYSDTCAIEAARTIKRMIYRMMDDMGLHRLVTYNLDGMALHHRWCEWLGFEYGGLDRKFDDEGRDYFRYALVR